MDTYAKDNVLKSLENAITYTSFDDDWERRCKVAALIEAFKARISRIYNGGDSPYSRDVIQNLFDVLAGNTQYTNLDDFRKEYASGGVEVDYDQLTIQFEDCGENRINVITIL